MCGLSAVFDLHKSKDVSNAGHNDNAERREGLAAPLDRSVESQRHRVPDAKGTWIAPDNRVSLGHVRLSTRDLSSAGNQPLHSSDEADDIHIVVNGELYYDTALRDSLGLEYAFQSTSDSDLLIPLYKRYGTAFTDHLRGEFALVLYDGKSQTLVAARDRFGVKPLHYCVFNGRLLVATQCKGIVQLLDDSEKLQWDVHCLAQGGGHYGSRTLFEGIRKFPPGHILIVRQDQSEEVLEFKPYFETKYTANKGGLDTRSAEELITDLRSRLLEAVSLRTMESDVPVGILLSGGVDSSAVAGMAARLSKQRLEASNCDAPPLPTCFTIGFSDDVDDLDESAIARRTAESLGLPFEKVHVTEQILADEFDEACWLGETLMWDLQHIAKKALSKHIASRGLKVVLNGDGSDELFGGYSHFVADRLLADDEHRGASLQSVSSAQREKLQQEYPQSWFGQEDKDYDENGVATELGLPPGFCNMAVSKHDDWLVKEVQELSDPFQALRECLSATEVEEMADYHPMHRSMLAWSKTVLPNVVIAAISDGAEMAHGVESRPPFLDHVVAEFSYSLPVDTLVHLEPDKPLVEKWIFREAVRPFITEETYKTRKHAFEAPFRREVGGPLYVKLSSVITQENVERLGFVEWDKCENIVERSFGGKDQLLYRQAIWLAQIISMGLQFGVQPWRKDGHAGGTGGSPGGMSKEYATGNANGSIRARL